MARLDSLIPARVRFWLLPALCPVIAGALAAVFVFDVPASKLLWWALVLACPLSHLLMGHGGHSGQGGGHESGHVHSTGPTTPPASDPNGR